MRPVIPEILSVLANSTILRPSTEMTVVWEGLLAGYSDEALRRAAALVARQVHYGPPTVGHIVEAIEGKVEKRQIPVTDNYNRKILRESGGYVTETVLVRVWPDGREMVEGREELPQSDRGRIGSGVAHLSEGFDDALRGLGEGE